MAIRKEAKIKDMLYQRSSLFAVPNASWDFRRIPTDVPVGMDYETMLDTGKAEIVAFAWGPDRATQTISFDIAAIEDAGKIEAFKADYFAWLDSATRIVAHNMSTELAVTRMLGYDIDKLYGRFSDSMPMCYVLNSKEKVGLKPNIWKFFKTKRQSWSTAFYKSREEYRAYCEDDAFDCLRLFTLLDKEVDAKDCREAYQVEETLVWALLAMRDTGVAIDVPMLRALQKEVKEEEIGLLKQVFQAAGKPDMQVNSTKEIKRFLFEELKVPMLKEYIRSRKKEVVDNYCKAGTDWVSFEVKNEYGAVDRQATLTRSGAGYKVVSILQGALTIEFKTVSVDKTVIALIAQNRNSPKRAQEFCTKLLEYRDVNKFSSSQLFDPTIIHNDGRIRTEFVSCGTKDEENTAGGPVTSRLSSRHPNLQNISARNEKRKIIRKAFIAPPGYKLIVADWKAAEVRGITHFAKSKNFTEVFANDGDPHLMTAENLIKAGMFIREHIKAARNAAKMVNFATPYNITARALAKKFTPAISEKVAQQLLDIYFDNNPEIVRYLRKAKEWAQDNKYVRLVSGQWIYFGDLEYTDNKACNYPIQGLIGCLSKLVICWSYLHYYGTDIKMVMQIHDEMIWQVPEHLAEREKKVIEYAMVNIHPMSVPFPADIKITDNWYDGH